MRGLLSVYRLTSCPAFCLAWLVPQACVFAACHGSVAVGLAVGIWAREHLWQALLAKHVYAFLCCVWMLRDRKEMCGERGWGG